MSLIKNEIPILEYDDNQTAVIMPNRKSMYSFPSKAVFAFLLDEIENYAVENGCEQIGEVATITKVFPIYKTVYKNTEICLCHAPLGSAAATQLMDFLIGCGVREIISAGSCGALVELEENEFLIPVEALRGEGTSYHYLPPSRTVKLNADSIQCIKSSLEENDIPYVECKTWTTDGFFRETKDMVEYRKAEGCQVVEMECAALAACAQFRQVKFGQMLFTADSLANVEEHEERDWGSASFPIALKACFDAVVRF